MVGHWNNYSINFIGSNRVCFSKYFFHTTTKVRNNMSKGMTFTLVVLVLLFLIIFIVAMLFLLVGKDYLFKTLNDLPSLLGGKK